MSADVPYETIGFRAPVEVKERAAVDANRLGMTTAEYGRMAFLRLLDADVGLEEAEPYRSPPTKKEMRERARRTAETNGSTPTTNGHRPASLARREATPIPKAGAGKGRRR